MTIADLTADHAEIARLKTPDNYRRYAVGELEYSASFTNVPLPPADDTLKVRAVIARDDRLVAELLDAARNASDAEWGEWLASAWKGYEGVDWAEANDGAVEAGLPVPYPDECG